MNFEYMLDRLIAGLVIIENASGDVSIIGHSYMIAAPTVDKSAYSESDIEELQDTLGWAWSDDFGWVFPTLA